MDKYSLWNKRKSSGTFRRQLKRNRVLLLERLNRETNETSSDCVESESAVPVSSETVARHRTISPENLEVEFLADNDAYLIPDKDDVITFEDEAAYFSPDENYDIPTEDEEVGMVDHDYEPLDDHDYDDYEPLDEFLRKWAIQFNIRQYAMTVLLKKLKKTFKQHCLLTSVHLCVRTTYIETYTFKLLRFVFSRHIILFDNRYAKNET